MTIDQKSADASTSFTSQQLAEYLGVSGRTVHGFLAEAELVQAADRMTFDHGETEIWVASKEESREQYPRDVIKIRSLQNAGLG